MKYMLILASNPADEPAPDSAEFGPSMEEWFAYSTALNEAGARVPNATFGTVEVRPVMEFG